MVQCAEHVQPQIALHAWMPLSRDDRVTLLVKSALAHRSRCMFGRSQGQVYLTTLQLRRECHYVERPPRDADYGRLGPQRDREARQQRILDVVARRDHQGCSHGRRIDRRSLLDNAADTLQRLVQWLQQLECPLGQHHPALGRDQERIAKRLTEPRQPRRQGRLTKVKPARGARDVAFRKQGFERDEQSEIEVPGIHCVDNGMQKVRFQCPRRLRHTQQERAGARDTPIDGTDTSLPKASFLASPPGSLIAFPLLAITLFLFFVSASVPSPLFVVFQERWGFSPGMLTVAFSIYSLVLLVTLLVAGSLSDHLGRKPVIVAALIIQVASMAIFVTADGIGGLLAARIVQGLSMGVVNGALSAAVIEAAPPARKVLGSLLTSISPLAGLATGALVTEALLGVTSQAEVWAFGFLGGVFCLCAVSVALVPETASPVPGLLRSMMPSVHVARAARSGFMRGLPLLLSIWALCGFIIALGPSLLRNVFSVNSGLLNGATVAVLCGAGAVSPLLMFGQSVGWRRGAWRRSRPGSACFSWRSAQAH